MDEFLLDKIINILPGIKAEINDRVLYLLDVSDINDFLKLKYALINLENNSYKVSTKIELDISKYLENNKFCDFFINNNIWYIKNIKSLDVIHIIYTYKMLNELSPNIELEAINLNKTDVHNVIKQYIIKSNYEYMMSSIKLIIDK